MPNDSLSTSRAAHLWAKAREHASNAFIGGLVFARSSYLAPYRTLGGQVVLCVLLGAFLALIVYVQRLSRFTRPARFLSLKGLR